MSDSYPRDVDRSMGSIVESKIDVEFQRIGLESLKCLSA